MRTMITNINVNVRKNCPTTGMIACMPSCGTRPVSRLAGRRVKKYAKNRTLTTATDKVG